MKRLISVFCVALSVAMLTGYASAFTLSDEIPAEDIFSPEIVERESVSSWAADEIAYARAAGLVTPHTSEYMTRDTTRFQFAELIVNMVEKVLGREIEPAPLGTFVDSDEPVMRKAYAAGIVGGVGNHEAAPDTTTNREQIGTMIARAVKYIEAETGKTYAPAAPSLDKFTDKAQVSVWAVEGLGLLAANGIMGGVSATEAGPKTPCSVEMSILLVYRFYAKTL